MPVQKEYCSCGQLGQLAEDCSTFSSGGKKVTLLKKEDVVKVEKRLRNPLYATTVEDVDILQDSALVMLSSVGQEGPVIVMVGDHW